MINTEWVYSFLFNNQPDALIIQIYFVIRTQIEYQNKYYDIDQKDEGT